MIRTDVVWFVGKIMVPANFAKVWLRHLPKQLQIIGDKGAKVRTALFSLWFHAVLSEFLCWIVIGGIIVH